MEERIIALEQAATEYRPVLQNVAYELTMVKGLTIDQLSATQELKRDWMRLKSTGHALRNNSTLFLFF
jgi:hypothetical protein